MEIKLLFLSTLVLLVCCIARNNFDHFLLVQTWPHGYCERIPRNCSIRNYFVIHGLWPVTAKGKAFLSRKRKRVNVSDTVCILPFLRQYLVSETMERNFERKNFHFSNYIYYYIAAVDRKG